jgi:integrating conjugative element protein (TIGR03757 family)
MTRNKAYLLAPMAAIVLCLSLPARATEVMLFTAEGLRPVANADQATAVFVLGDTGSVLKGLHFPNPGNPQAARQTALARLEQPVAQQALAQLREQANAAAMAQLLGIERLPAVLVAPGYVVYGVYDVAEALRKVEAYRADH